MRYINVSAFFLGAGCVGDRGLSVGVLRVRFRRSLGDHSVCTSSAVSGSWRNYQESVVERLAVKYSKLENGGKERLTGRRLGYFAQHRCATLMMQEVFITYSRPPLTINRDDFFTGKAKDVLFEG